ncbi:MAG: tyrosine-type recombinase/integrase [Elusimicrobiota bacterium]
MVKKIKRGERKQDRWEANFYLGSRRVKKKFSTYDEAENFEIQEKAKFNSGGFLPLQKNDRTPFDKYAEEYYRIFASVNMVNPKINEFYRIKEFKKYFSGKPLCYIKQRDIEEWKAMMIGQGKKKSTINRSLTSLRSLFNQAVKDGKIRENPTSQIKKLREDNQRIRYLTEQEIHQLLEGATPRLQDFIILGVNTGLRKQNLIDLSWNDVDTIAGVIHVLKTKSGKAYEVPMNETVFRLIQRLAELQKCSSVLDTINLKREWETAVKAAALKDVNIHTLRHTYASHMTMKGVDIFTLSKLMGHADIKMTQRYSHLAPNFKKIAANMINLTTKNVIETNETSNQLATFSSN